MYSYIHTYVLIIFWDMNQLHCFFLQVLAFSEGWNATTIYNGTCSSYLVPKSWIMFKPLNLGKWPTSSNLSSTPTCPAPRQPRPFRSDHRVGRLRSGCGSDECGGLARATRLDLWRWTGEGEGHGAFMGTWGIHGDRLILAGKISTRLMILYVSQDALIILICGFAPK